MAQKDDLKAALDAAGITYDADATLAELKALLPVDEEDKQEEVVPEGPFVPDYSFAVNKIKLNRAKDWVLKQAQLTATTAPIGEALEAAVKERYTMIGGLLRSHNLAGKAGKSKNVVNMAPEDKE